VALKVSALRSLARRLRARVPGLGLLVIDYLQLLDPEPEDRKQMREVQVATMSRGLKALAKELGIPVLCLAQLNRSVEQRADRRPNMSDLRESGAIEQDADQVLFIYREDYYKPDSQRKGIAEIIVAKNRSGRMGTAELVWKPDYQAFLSLDRRDGY
jgi:replicative DNA helicase